MARDGRFIEFVPLPDPLCTNLCFGGPYLQTAYVTLSGTGRLVSPLATTGASVELLIEIRLFSLLKPRLNPALSLRSAW